jgi:molecular chaperone HtpG
VTEEEYHEFYRHVSHDWNTPAKVISQKSEGLVSYESLLFIPSKKPMDWLYDRGNGGLQLFVKKIMIMEQCEELLPRYMRFVKGVVESTDLPLNVSREILQENRQIKAIQKGLVKKVLKELKDWKSEAPEAYHEFWMEFGVALKEGVASEPGSKEKLEDLLLFESSHDAEKLTDLASYIERMPETQKEIYYITGESRAVVESSPHLEAVRAKGYEILFLTEPVDEFVLANFDAYQEKKLVSAAKEGLNLDTDEEKEATEKVLKEKEEVLAPLIKDMTARLEAYVSEVRLSARLTESPACLVVSDKGMTPQMERMMKHMNQSVPVQKRIMEINPDHAIIEKLTERLTAKAGDDLVEDFTWMLYDQALMSEGSPVVDNAKYGQRLSKLMTQAL